MKYFWTEDTGAGLHFWKLVNQLFFNDALVVESKESNQGLLDALAEIDMKEDDKYYISFDYVVDNQDIRNKYRMLKSIADKAEGKIIILDMICFEYLILAFDKLVAWTGTGKTDKIKIREEVLSTIENHRINLSKIGDEKTLQYLASFKRYSTERVMKSLVGEFTQNEKWSVMNVLHQTVIPEHAKWVLCKKSKDTKNIKDGRQIIKNAIVKYCGAICIDEVQDIDKHMQEIIEELSGMEIPMILMGDPKQDLNGFKCLRNLMSIYEQNVRYISECHRCPQLHLELSNRLVDKNEKQKSEKDSGQLSVYYESEIDCHTLIERQKYDLMYISQKQGVYRFPHLCGKNVCTGGKRKTGLSGRNCKGKSR